jgi:hypothetical protein
VETIRDQRHMIGLDRHESVEDVRTAWERWAQERGFAIRIRAGDRSTDFRRDQRHVTAYVSGGTWIADCPNCNGGIACWSENPDGACLDCGRIFTVDHPSEADRDRVVDLLARRPDPLTRNWHRHQSETLEDLERENAEMVPDADDGLVVPASEVRRILGDSALDRLRDAGSV